MLKNMGISIGLECLSKVLLLLAVCSVGSFGQDKSKPVQIDEFGIISCEDLMARADNIGNTLRENKSGSVFIVIYGNGSVSKKADHYAKFVHRAIIGRWGNDLDVTILRDTSRDALGGEAWLVGSDQIFDKPTATLFDKIPFKVDRRILYDRGDGDPCSNHMISGFAKVLKSNPETVGLIVDLNGMERDKANSAQVWLDNLRDEGISRDRLRIFFKRTNATAFGSSPYTEFWIVPKFTN